MTSFFKIPYKVHMASEGTTELRYTYINAEKIMDFKSYENSSEGPTLCIKYGISEKQCEWINTPLLLEDFIAMLQKAGIPVIDCGIDPELSEFVKDNWGNSA